MFIPHAMSHGSMLNPHGSMLNPANQFACVHIGDGARVCWPNPCEQLSLSENWPLTTPESRCEPDLRTYAGVGRGTDGVAGVCGTPHW